MTFGPPVHYADEDRGQPLCGGGEDGDLMTFFLHETTCDRCRALLGTGHP